MKKSLSITLFLTLLITIGCTDESNEIVELNDSSFSLIEALTQQSLTSKLDTPPIWADMMPYTGLVVPATFKAKGPFDELYAMPNREEGGLHPFHLLYPLISDSKPGDKDYNGGRWHLNVLKPEVDPMKYRHFSSDMDFDLDDFMSTDMYFECPLRKVKK